MPDQAEFTPGPWHVVDRVNVQSGPIGFLAYVSTAGARGRTIEEAEANAQLIAAAPDLLAACEALISALETAIRDFRAVGMHQVPAEKQALALGRATIAKALGKERDNAAS